MKHCKTILFVVHESKKSGAPLLLLNLLRMFEQSAAFNIEILISKTGELDDAFDAIAATYFYNPKYLSALNLKSKILRKVLPKAQTLKRYQKNLYHNLEAKNYDCIYFNSLGCYPIFPFLENYKAKKVVHVHELNDVVSGMDQHTVKKMLNNADVIVSSYNVVTDFLKNQFQIQQNDILQNAVYLFPDRKVAIDALDEVPKPADAIFRIGGCGSVELRKGTDIFVDFAIKTIKEMPEVSLEFIWVGNAQTELAETLKATIKTEKLEHHITFVGSTPTPEVYFKTLDVFFLSSREEAFGLVALENAYCKNPLVCFDIIGDLPLFINQYKCGKVIPKYDFNVFKAFIMELIEDSSYARALGEEGKKAVVNYFNIEDQAKVIKEVLVL
ncbi:Glycosyltransferase involved in cell wall bisynthesis [Flavobacteriaceae bacterium MAR_2010_188]|nr:Glycosyltransferase involved in cell wall bisynthesis [Flavobacteriaceae bacterium MAR_2010_188]